MVLPCSGIDREYQKFFEDKNGKVGVNVGGSVSPSGLTVGGLITEVSLNSSSWVALPATSLYGRNAICIQNTSGVEMKINYDDTVGGYVGIKIPNGGERYYDISEPIVIYGKLISGTATIVLEELA